MTIEQTLMRMMKCVGGLTHGRGITDSVLAMDPRTCISTERLRLY